MRFMAAMASRKNPETRVPMTPAMSLNRLNPCWRLMIVTAMTIVPRSRTSEWPMEKKKPTVAGRLPSCMSLRVTLSMAAM